MQIKKIFFYFDRYGLAGFTSKIFQKFVTNRTDRSRERDYQKWILSGEPLKDHDSQRATTFPEMPLVSVVVPVYDTPAEILSETIDSVLNQTYSHWEICLACGGTSRETQAVLNELANTDKRVKVKFLTDNFGIAGNTNEAIRLASGEFLAFLDHDDLLAPCALFAIVKAINDHMGADFLYSDEDVVSEDGKTRMKPHFKPDFAPDTLRSYNYISHLMVIKKSLGDAIGWFRDGFDGSQDYDIILRATEKASLIIHIPNILYHWRISETSVSGNPGTKVYAYEAARKALSDHLARIGLEGKVEYAHLPTSYKINYAHRGDPGVSIIIPNSDNARMLKRCLNSIRSRSTYRNYEVLIMENGSVEQRTKNLYEELRKEANIRVIEWKKPFNYSAVNNAAAGQARHPVLLFLNNDIEVISPDWIENMLGFALRRDVGAVGAKLYFADNSIQHAGVILGLHGTAGHPYLRLPRSHLGYANRLMVAQNLSAVTGACLMTRRDVFDRSGGFDETLSLAYNDVNLCLEMGSLGYLIVWTPFAELLHHESKTRGYEDTPVKMLRFEAERDIFIKRWRTVLEAGDPYYNSNLALDRKDFGLKIEKSNPR